MAAARQTVSDIRNHLQDTMTDTQTGSRTERFSPGFFGEFQAAKLVEAWTDIPVHLVCWISRRYQNVATFIYVS